MKRFDSKSHEAITEAIERAERTTSAEILVEVVKQSGLYRDVDFLAGAYAALAVLIAMLLVPWQINPWLMPLDLLVTFLLTAETVRRTDLRRAFTTRRRRTQQVNDGAQLVFAKAGATATKARNAVLLYCSVLERRTIAVCDVGAVNALPPEQWKRFTAQLTETRFDPAGALPRQVEQLGALLAQHFPATSDNPNELPNAPRFR